MKTSIKYIVAIFAMALTFVSCSNDDETAVNELEGITKFKEITNDTHTIELYSHMGSLEQGYNEISLRIKENATNNYIKNINLVPKKLILLRKKSSLWTKCGI